MRMEPTRCGKFNIRVIPCSEMQRVVDYLIQFYFTDEPLSKCLNLTGSAQAVQFLRTFCMTALRENISIMATTTDGQIAAVSCNIILRKNEQFNFDVEPKISKIATFVMKAIHEAKVFETFSDVDEAMYIAFMSVHPDFRNQGLAKVLLDRSRSLALNLGLKVMRMDCCSLYTAKAAQRFGWKCLNEIKYIDYIVNGEQVFRPEAPHTCLGIYGTRIDKSVVIFKSPM